MSTALRPLSTGELLDQTFAMYRRNFWLFLGIGLPFPAISLVLRFYETFAISPLVRGMAKSLVYQRLAWEGATMVLGSLFCLSITHAATVRAVSAVHLSWRIGIRESYAAIKARIGQVIGIAFWQIVLAVAGAAAAFIVAFILAIVTIGIFWATGVEPAKLSGSASLAIGLMVILGAVAGACFGMARFALAEQVCVIENKGIIASLKRSLFLSRRSFWRIVLVYSLFFGLSSSIAYGALVVVRFAMSPFYAIRLTSVLQALAAFCVSAVLGPLGTVGMSLVYYDERVRKEGFDLELLIETLDGPIASAATAD